MKEPWELRRKFARRANVERELKLPTPSSVWEAPKRSLPRKCTYCEITEGDPYADPPFELDLLWPSLGDHPDNRFPSCRMCRKIKGKREFVTKNDAINYIMCVYCTSEIPETKHKRERLRMLGLLRTQPV